MTKHRSTHKVSSVHYSRAKRTKWSLQQYPWTRHTKRHVRYGNTAGYYSATMHVWMPTNARRHALQAGGYESGGNVGG